MATAFRCRYGSDRPRDQLQWRELDGHRRSTGELRFLRPQQWEQRYLSADRPTSKSTRAARPRFAWVSCDRAAAARRQRTTGRDGDEYDRGTAGGAISGDECRRDY